MSKSFSVLPCNGLDKCAGSISREIAIKLVEKSESEVGYVVGINIEQFGELGTVESGKAVFEVISPVSGKITAVNEELSSAP